MWFKGNYVGCRSFFCMKVARYKEYRVGIVYGYGYDYHCYHYDHHHHHHHHHHHQYHTKVKSSDIETWMNPLEMFMISLSKLRFKIKFRAAYSRRQWVKSWYDMKIKPCGVLTWRSYYMTCCHLLRRDLSALGPVTAPYQHKNTQYSGHGSGQKYLHLIWG